MCRMADSEQIVTPTRSDQRHMTSLAAQIDSIDVQWHMGENRNTKRKLENIDICGEKGLYLQICEFQEVADTAPKAQK